MITDNEVKCILNGDSFYNPSYYFNSVIDLTYDAMIYIKHSKTVILFEGYQMDEADRQNTLSMFESRDNTDRVLNSLKMEFNTHRELLNAVIALTNLSMIMKRSCI